jgi:hypothetical protein
VYSKTESNCSAVLNGFVVPVNDEDYYYYYCGDGNSYYFDNVIMLIVLDAYGALDE